MAAILKRTPVKGTEDPAKVGRPSNPKHTELYAKSMHLTLTGGSREQIQAVAATIHKAIADHDHVKGGKSRKKVHVLCNSSDPLKIFDGTIHTDSV